MGLVAFDEVGELALRWAGVHARTCRGTKAAARSACRRGRPASAQPSCGRHLVGEMWGDVGRCGEM